MAEAAVEVARLSLPAAEKGNPNAVSDAGVAVLLAEAAAQTAALNVRINLAWIDDDEFNRDAWSRIEAVLSETGAPARHRASASPTARSDRAYRHRRVGGIVAATIIDGKAIAAELRAELTAELEELKRPAPTPGIATLMVGDDFGAGMYRGAVEKFCGEMGLGYRSETLPADATEAAVVAAVHEPQRRSGRLRHPAAAAFPGAVSDSVVINSIDAGQGRRLFPPVQHGPAGTGRAAPSPRRRRRACMELLERYLTRRGQRT